MSLFITIIRQSSPGIFGPYNDFDVQAGDQVGYTERLVIPATRLLQSASEFYVKFGYFNTEWKITKCYIGHLDTTTGNANFLADPAPVQIKFSGNAASPAIGSGGLISDKITFALDKTKALVISLYLNETGKSDPPRKIATENYQMFYRSGDYASTAEPAGLSESGNSGKRYFVSEIYK